jgi:plasmid stabilization system protein ParE
MSLTTEQRDALRALLAYTECNGQHAAQKVAGEVRTLFADALRPPKMATREYNGRAQTRYRIVRMSDGVEWLEQWFCGSWHAPFTDESSAAILAAARDPEFHEVTD